MRARIATVLTSGTWERELVAAARAAGTVRVVQRCVDPTDVDPGSIDGLIAGAETPWLTESLVRRLRAAGLVVVGMRDRRDRSPNPALSVCDAVFDHTDPPARIIAAISAMAPVGSRSGSVAPLISVVGARGTPGCTEVAIALALITSARRRVMLTEVDPEAPGLGIRLALPPTTGDVGYDPSLGTRPPATGPLHVVAAPVRGGPMSRSLRTRLIETARLEFEAVVVDCGAVEPWTLGFDPGRPVLVVRPTPEGLIRTGRLVSNWTGPEPLVVLNHVGGSDEVALRSARAAAGLEPIALIRTVDGIRNGEPAPAGLLAPLVPVVDAVLESTAAAAGSAS